VGNALKVRVVRRRRAVLSSHKSGKEVHMRARPIVRAAAVQMSPVLYSREATLEKVVRQIHELGQQGVQPALSVVPGQFLLKDVVLLAARDAAAKGY
jgi:hypothetical protein